MQINRKKRRLILSAAVLAAAGLLIGSVVVRREALHRVAVHTTCVEQRNVTGHVICYGELEYGKNYGLYAQRTVQPQEWMVEQGSAVSAGQVLLTGSIDADITLRDSIYSLWDAEEIAAALASMTGRDTGSVTTARQQMTMQERNSSYELLSPVDGVVTQITPLGAAPARTTLLVIADPDSMQLSAQIPEEYVQDIGVGMACEITGSAFRDHTYTGVITDIAPFAYTEFTLTGEGQRVVDLTIRVDDPDDALGAGFSATAKIENYVMEDALFVPNSAVMQDENNVEYVYVIHMGRAFRRDVITGQRVDDNVEIVQGLALDERVISYPLASYYDGMPVRQGRADAGT